MTRSEVRGLPVAALDSYDYVWSEWERPMLNKYGYLLLMTA